ncbi:hypothetical protein, partial [Paenibacillus sp. HB172176]|uniref:hypothetical protein n=1 Tax=Paenibacillus sp. HB172176 TaxID=2493690 RepID=UPI001981D73F
FFETSDFREVGLFFARNHHTIHYAAFIFVLNLPLNAVAHLRKASIEVFSFSISASSKSSISRKPMLPMLRFFSKTLQQIV